MFPCASPSAAYRKKLCFRFTDAQLIVILVQLILLSLSHCSFLFWVFIPFYFEAKHFLTCWFCSVSVLQLPLCVNLHFWALFPVRNPRQAPDLSRCRFTQERTWQVSQGTWLHCESWSGVVHKWAPPSHTSWSPRGPRLENLKMDITVSQHKWQRLESEI